MIFLDGAILPGCNLLKQNAEKCPILTAVVSMD